MNMNIPPLNRILLVDDDTDIQTVGKMALEIVGGLTVEVCSSGEEVIRKLPLFKPDLVLLDVMLPGMDGPAIFEAIKKIPDFQQIPVIFLTARVQTQDIDSYQKLGVIAVLKKPFDPMMLAKQVKEIWDGYYEKGEQ